MIREAAEAPGRLDHLITVAIRDFDRDTFLVFLDALEEVDPERRRLFDFENKGNLHHTLGLLSKVCPDVVSRRGSLFEIPNEEFSKYGTAESPFNPGGHMCDVFSNDKATFKNNGVLWELNLGRNEMLVGPYTFRWIVWTASRSVVVSLYKYDIAPNANGIFVGYSERQDFTHVPTDDEHYPEINQILQSWAERTHAWQTMLEDTLAPVEPTKKKHDGVPE